MDTLEDLYDQQVGKVYKFFYVQVLDKQTAQDLTSQTFVAYVEKAKDSEIQQPKQYLYGIMRNVWSTHLREKYAKKQELIDSIDNFEDFTIDEISRFESTSYIQRAESYIQRLPKKQQQVATMRFLDGMRVRDIAQKLGKTTSYVKTTQNRALKSLRSMLNDYEGVEI